MQNPPHVGELIRESMDAMGWDVSETIVRLDCSLGRLLRLLSGKAGMSATLALALEDAGWSTAEHWMRMQVNYELAQARRYRSAAARREGALCT